MSVKFKLWSETNPSIKEILRPNLGMRSWDNLTNEEKDIIWRHFINKGWFNADKETYWVVYYFNEDNKARAFCKHILNHGGPHLFDGPRECCTNEARLDFHHIFHEESQNVIYELFSYYIKSLQKITYKELLPVFKDLFNNLSNQFGLNILITEDSLIPKQDERIIKDIYQPILSYLSDKKWEKVNEILSDAFSDYRKNTPQGYSGCVTKTISALQAFLQTLINGKIGGVNGINNLVKQAQEKKLIPDDKFSSEIFKNIDTILMKERGKSGDAHPKLEYANEKNARLVLNLVMIFLQHCIQK